MTSATKKSPVRADLDQARRHIARGYAKGLPCPEPYTTAELLRIHKQRTRRDLTPEEAWYLHCSADLPEWNAGWFQLSVTAVRKLQESPHRGEPWTRADYADLAPLFAAQIKKLNAEAASNAPPP